MSINDQKNCLDYEKIGSTVHEYEYLGDKLMYEKRGSYQFHYRYDAFGNLAGITREDASGSLYRVYVLCNSRGDVLELRNQNGTVFAKYVYDAWGNVLHVLNSAGNEITSTTNLANQNPFRYRGYYYDSESGLYYLQSRYYDPVTGRFLNADSILDNRKVNTLNQFSYCGNNPTNNADPTGHISGTIIGGIVGGVIGGLGGALSAVVKGKSITAGIVTGAISGAVIGGICGFVADTGGVGAIILGTLACGAVAAGANAANQYVNYRIEKKSSTHTNISVSSSKNPNYSSKTSGVHNSKNTSSFPKFSEYVDKRSIAVSTVSAIVFAPMSIGASCIANSAFAGLDYSLINTVAEVAGNFILGGIVSTWQAIIELF